MNNSSSSDLARRWEKALSNYEELDSQSWGQAFKVAVPQGYDQYDDDLDAEREAHEEFESEASTFCLGSLILEFPQSTHGDARVVSVYKLPAGTTVLVLYATYEVEGPSGLVFNGDDFTNMLELAHSLLFDGVDASEVQNLDEDSKFDPDTLITYEGEAAIRTAWEKSLNDSEYL